MGIKGARITRTVCNREVRRLGSRISLFIRRQQQKDSQLQDVWNSPNDVLLYYLLIMPCNDYLYISHLHTEQYGRSRYRSLLKSFLWRALPITFRASAFSDFSMRYILCFSLDNSIFCGPEHPAVTLRVYSLCMRCFPGGPNVTKSIATRLSDIPFS